MCTRASRSFEKAVPFPVTSFGSELSKSNFTTLTDAQIHFALHFRWLLLLCTIVWPETKLLSLFFFCSVRKLPKQFRVGYCVLGEHLSKIRTKRLFHAHTKSFYSHFVYMCNFSLVPNAKILDNGVIALDTNIRLLKATETFCSIMYLTTLAKVLFSCRCHSLRFGFFLSLLL